jgi:hypothetical protein
LWHRPASVDIVDLHVIDAGYLHFRFLYLSARP